MHADHRVGIRRIAPELFVVAMLGVASGCATHQQVMFAPSIATVADDGRGVIALQGRISEAPESLKREAIIDSFPLHIKPDPNRQDPLFRARAGQFWSDSDMIEPVTVKMGSRVLELRSTDSGGYFNLQVPLTSAEALQLKTEGVLSFESIATSRMPCATNGEALFVPEVGLTVITDVDDTIKVTDVADKPERDANTFVRPFRPVPYMPELYMRWQAASGRKIHFHVVSAGPWQLHEPLRKFTKEAGFPSFTWQMRSMKITDLESLKEALDPDVAAQRREDFKVGAIRDFMLRFERRHVVLVGDSGEQDPEVYARILSEFPDRVDWVLIRDVSNDPGFANRNRDALIAGPQRAKLKIFSDPRDLFTLLP